MSRPLLGLILLNEEYFKQLRDQVSPLRMDFKWWPNKLFPYCMFYYSDTYLIAENIKLKIKKDKFFIPEFLKSFQDSQVYGLKFYYS